MHFHKCGQVKPLGGGGLVDDGSPDNSGKMGDEYAKGNKRIFKIEVQENYVLFISR